MVIEESAILNTGHTLRSIKSRTWPYAIRSKRLPNAPARTRNSPDDKRRTLGLLIRRTYNIRQLVTMVRAVRIKGALSLNRPKAAPLLQVGVIWRIPLMIGVDEPI